jgi:hypothetical protein
MKIVKLKNTVQAADKGAQSNNTPCYVVWIGRPGSAG